MVTEFLKRLPELSRTRKRAILVGYDIVAMAAALWAAFSTRLGVMFMPDSRELVFAALVSFGVGIVALFRLHIYHIVLRYFDLRTVSRILGAAAIAAVAWVVAAFFIRDTIMVNGMPTMVPRSVALIYCGFLFLLLFQPAGLYWFRHHLC